MMKIKNINFSYPGKEPIFNDFSIEINSTHGKIVALMGESGSGKTTFVNLVSGLLKPNRGAIDLDETKTMSYLAQVPILFEHLSIADNSMFFSTVKNLKNKFNQTLFDELIVTLDLQDIIKRNDSVSNLSGGQKQRIALLRSLSIKPDILLLDEPTTGLDASVKYKLLQKIRRLTDKYGIFVLYITHQIDEAKLIADEIIYFNKNDDSSVTASLSKMDDFLETSPFLKAYEATTYPILNKLSGNFIPPAFNLNPKGVDSRHTLIIDQSSMSFSAISGGLEVNVLSRTPVYTTLVLKTSQQELQVSTIRCPKYVTMYVSFSGAGKIYDNTGKFISSILLEQIK